MAAVLLSYNELRRLKPKDRPYELRDSKIHGLIIRVQPTGRKYWYVEYQRKQRKRVGVWPGVATEAAREAALSLIGKVVDGYDPKEVREKDKRETALKDFINDKYEPWAKASLKFGQGTVDRVRSRFADLLDNKLGELTPWIVEKWRLGRLKKVKAHTVKRDIAALQQVLSKAVEWKVIDSNPIKELRPTKTDDNQRVRYLSQDEEQRLRRALKGAPRYLQAMVLVSINTGIRQGEMFGMKWDDINLSTRNLTVVSGTAKNRKTRHIPLNDEAYEALIGWHSEGGGFVFPSKAGGRMNNVKRSWASLVSNAEIQNFHWHDQRHHFASRLVQSGVDLNMVRELMGHADIKMVLRYAHLTPEHKFEAVQKIVNSG